MKNPPTNEQIGTLTMKLSERQILLSYFQNRNESKHIVVCDISGISFEILSPVLPILPGLCFSGLSPLASRKTAETIALRSYSSCHASLAPSTLAGVILSLLHHLHLREDKLSAVEANMSLSRLPLFLLSQTCSFLANIKDWEAKRIPHIDIEEDNLKGWLGVCQTRLDYSTAGDAPAKAISASSSLAKSSFLDQSIIVEDRKEARILLKNLKESKILPLRLQTIITMSIQKNNLAMLGSELRGNITAALLKLGTPDCIALAAIFTKTAKHLTQQEAIVSQLLDEPVSAFHSPVSLSLAEIIARKKEQAKRKPLDETMAMIASIQQEEQEEQQREQPREGFEDHDESLDAIMVEAGIEELDLEGQDYQQEEDKDNNGLDFNSWQDFEGEQS